MLPPTGLYPERSHQLFICVNSACNDTLARFYCAISCFEVRSGFGKVWNGSTYALESLSNVFEKSRRNQEEQYMCFLSVMFLFTHSGRGTSSAVCPSDSVFIHVMWKISFRNMSHFDILYLVHDTVDMVSVKCEKSLHFCVLRKKKKNNLKATSGYSHLTELGKWIILNTAANKYSLIVLFSHFIRGTKHHYFHVKMVM